MGVIVNHYFLPQKATINIPHNKLKRAIKKVAKIVAEHRFKETELIRNRLENLDTIVYSFGKKNEIILIDESEKKERQKMGIILIPLDKPQIVFEPSLKGSHWEHRWTKCKPYLEYEGAKFIELCFHIESYDYPVFLGDGSYFFRKNDDSNLELSEYGEDEWKNIKCTDCNHELSDDFIILIFNLITQTRENLKMNTLFDIEQHGMICPNCGEIQDINQLTERTILGTFRIELEKCAPKCNSYIDLFEQELNCELVCEQYMYP
jgi:Zn finger protein HypA/HybF involved in hydrogenase expression